MMGRTGIFGLGLMAALTACADAQLTGVDGDPRVADLRAMEEWVADEASLDVDGLRAQALGRIQELLNAPAPETEAGRFLEIASIVGIADNGHSNIWGAPIYDFGILPVRTFWFTDGLYIVRARTEHADLVGARIDSIAGLTPEQLVARFDRYHGGTPEHFKHYFATPWLISPALLHADGVADSPDELRLFVTSSAGGARSVTLPVDPQGGAPARTWPWVRLLPGPLQGEGGAWTAVRTHGGALPFGLRDAGNVFRYEYMADRDVAYVQLRTNIDHQGRSVRDFADDVRDNLRRDEPLTIVLDNRFNGGGDLTRTARMARELPELVPADGAVYVLTSNATFSAGIYTSFFPKAADASRTTVVGEMVGDRTRFWAESRGAFELPASGYRIGQSLQMHDIGSGCPIRDVCHLGGRDLDIAVGSLSPDVPIAWTFADFMAGRDPAVDYAIGN